MSNSPARIPEMNDAHCSLVKYIAGWLGDFESRIPILLLEIATSTQLPVSQRELRFHRFFGILFTFPFCSYEQVPRNSRSRSRDRRTRTFRLVLPKHAIFPMIYIPLCWTGKDSNSATTIYVSWGDATTWYLPDSPREVNVIQRKD